MSETKPEVTKQDGPKIGPKISQTDEFIYKRDSRKSLRQIAKESQDRLKSVKEKLLTKSEEKPAEEGVVEKPKEVDKPVEEVKKPEISVEEIAKRAADEAAFKAAEASKKTFQDEMQKVLDKDKTLEEKQKEADELISVWDKEKRLPTDYKEIIQETLRISEAKYRQLAREDKERQEKQLQEEQSKAQAAKQQEQARQDAYVNDISRKVSQDLDDLYANNFLKRPPQQYDKEHVDQKATDELLQYGIKLNKERKEKNLPPIDSLAKIYFMHYKPYKDAQPKDNQPAGADAPVSGAKAPPNKESSKGYVYQRDHKKSYRQILQENFNRLRGS